MAANLKDENNSNQTALKTDMCYTKEIEMYLKAEGGMICRKDGTSKKEGAGASHGLDMNIV